MDLQRAKELLSGLADGVDPLTGEVLPEDHVCNKAEIIWAFHCVLKSLPGKSSKPQPENAGKPWNDADDAVLCQMFDAGGSKKEMCASGGFCANPRRLRQWFFQLAEMEHFLQGFWHKTTFTTHRASV